MAAFEPLTDRERYIIRVLDNLKNESGDGVTRCNEFCLFLLGKLEQTSRVVHLQALVKEHIHTGTSVGATLQQWELQRRSLDEAMAYLALWPTSGGKSGVVA